MTPKQQQFRYNASLGTAGYNKEAGKVNDMKGDKEVSIRNVLKNQELTSDQKKQKIRDIEMSFAQNMARIDPGSVPLWYKRKFGWSL